MTKIYCCECGMNVDARQTTGFEIYPHRKDLWAKVMHVCNACKNYVGSYDNGKPLGCIASQEIREQRVRIHALLDNIWKSGRAKRDVLYRRISKELGYEFHTANIKTVSEAEQVYAIVSRLAKAS